jgi:hypothetical protein
MSVCLVAIFKNESHILQEWITHYISQGIDKFFLIDNDSNDNYIEIVQPYITSGLAELFIDKRQSAQTECYNDNCLDKCKQYDWVIIADLDEFIYARKGYSTIKEYLEDINIIQPTVTQIFIPWKMFGSNGYNMMDKPQPSSVIQSFTKRAYYDKPDENYIHIQFVNNKKYAGFKCISKTKTLVKLHIHEHTNTFKYYISTCNIYTKLHEHFTEISEHILEESFLHMNHYIIQSKQWFMEVKAKRGDVNYDYNNRNEHYFHHHDILCNEVDDFELRDINSV